MDSNNLSKADRTRNFIIEKSAAVFNSKGYAGTSLNDIMEATGLTKGSVYGNFQNKDEVALAAFDYNYETVVSMLRSRIKSRDTIIDKLLVYPEFYRNFLKIPFLKGGCPILNTSTEADDTHPQLREKALHALNFWRRSVENLVKQGIETKEIKSNVDPGEFASILMTLVEGAVMLAKVTGKPKELIAAMDLLEQLIRNLKK